MPLTTRLPEWLERELGEFFREHGLGPSQGLRTLAEEWWAMERYPAIEFRDDPFGRRAALRGGPEVWEVVSAWRDSGEDLLALAQLFDWIDRRDLEQAIDLYRRFPDPVDAVIEENERVARLLAEALSW